MKKFKKIAAVFGTGLLMGTTMGMAADLGDLPAPFVTSGAYASTAFVVGAKAGTNDDGARTTLTGYFNPFVNAETGAIVASSKTEKIFIGENLSQEFSARLDDGDISAFWDDGIDFRGSNYETHEEIFVGGSGAGLGDAIYAVSSGLTGEEELGDAIKLYTGGANTSWGYRYVFDENMDENISTDHEMTINFLGKPIRISDTVAASNKVTMTTGEQYSMGQDSTVMANGHTVHIGTIFQTKAEIWVDSESHKFSSEGDVETFNIGDDQIEVKLDDIGYTEDVVSRTVLITAGENIETTVTDGDAVQTELGEPDVDDDAIDADWSWDIEIASNDIFNSSSYIGIEFNQRISKYDDSPLPIGDGEYWSTPFGYVTLDVAVPEVDYKEYQFVMEINYDINNTYEQDVLLITAVGQSSSNDGLDFGGTDTNQIAINGSGYAWYKDSNKKFQAAGLANAIAGTCEGANVTCIEASSVTTKWITFLNQSNEGLNGTYPAAYMHIEDVEIGDGNLYSGANITSNVSIANSRFGATVDADDVGDLSYYVPGTTHGVAVTRQLQTWDEGVARTIYGTLITGPSGIDDGNIEAGLDSDEFHLWFPEDEVYAEVTFNVRATGSAADPVLTNDAGASSYTNLILVGGPCVNTLTAEYMGLSADSCGATSTIDENAAIIKLVEDNSKTALIVAGWEKADTARAATTVAAGDLTGMEMPA